MEFFFEDKCRGNLADVDMWACRPKMYDWDLLTEEWARLGLKPIKGKACMGSPFPTGDLSPAVEDLMIILTDPFFWEITEKDIENFELLLEKAREELDLHYTYLADTYRITHDSSVDDVMKSIPEYKYVDDSRIRCMVQDAINVAKTWHSNTLSRFDFEMFIIMCNFITKTTPPSEALKKLKAHPRFRESAIKDLSDGVLEEKLKQYLCYLKFCEDKDANSSFKREITVHYEHYRTRYINAMNDLRVEFLTPAHFLIHRERFMGYEIGDPIAEITKLRVYFLDYIDGVPCPLKDSSSSRAAVPLPPDPPAEGCDEPCGHQFLRNRCSTAASSSCWRW